MPTYRVKTKQTEVAIVADNYFRSYFPTTDSWWAFFRRGKGQTVIPDVVEINEATPIYQVGQRVVWNGVEGTVYSVSPDRVAVLAGGNYMNFPPDGVFEGKELTVVPYLELSEFERDYKQALMDAGASSMAADYAVLKAREWRGTSDSPSKTLNLSFRWRQSPWGQDYWNRLYLVIKAGDKLTALFGSSPNLGDLVIAWDDYPLYTVGRLMEIVQDSNRPYWVESLDGITGNTFKNARCLKV